ncbi:MAG: hypothetical protein JXL97_18380 [Bacteroidales bacterium]|nr:hypothetical protein [Bacteroidales bacterium]
MKNKGLKIAGLIILVLLVGFFIGPREKAPKLSAEIVDTLPAELKTLEKFISDRENSIKTLKSDNESRIIWANPDSIHKTKYCFVYLHGFTASPIEGNGLSSVLSEKYNANIYLPRLQAHGTESDENMLDFNIEKYWKSAQESYLIGKKLGEKVILLGTSTGGSLALMIAAEYSDIEAIMLYSPNIDLYDNKSFILAMPWGLQITRLFYGGKYRSWDANEEQDKYWQHYYRLEALVKLKVMLKSYMTKELFTRVTQPVFLGYYYENDENQDHVVSVPAMLEMFDELGTPADKKVKVAFPKAGEHVLTWLYSAKSIDEVRNETFNFLDKIVMPTN